MARLNSVLVVDPDPQGLQTLTFGFVREGCRVMGATSYEDAQARIAGETFDVVVVALRDEPTACRGFLEDIAEHDGQPNAIVGLGTEQHRPIVGALPAADFLPMPAFIRDILTTAKLRAARHASAPLGGSESIVSGTLSEFGVFSIVRSLQATQQSAIVELERATRRGELRFAAGELTWAQAGSQQGTPALNQLLLWDEAALELRFKQVVVRRSQFSHKGPELIAEIERFLRDFVAMAKPLGAAHTVLVPTKGRDLPAGDATLAEIAPILRLFDGQRALSDVIDDSPFRVFDTCKVIKRFLDEGLLEPVGDAAPPPARGVRSPLLEEWLRAPDASEFVKSGDEVPALAPAAAPTSDDKPFRRNPRGARATQRMKTLRASAAPANALRVTPAAAEPAPAATPAPAAASAAADGQGGRRTKTGEFALGGTVTPARKDRPVGAQPSMVIAIPVDEPRAPSDSATPAPPPMAVERKRSATPAFGQAIANPRRAERPVLKVVAAERPATPETKPEPPARPVRETGVTGGSIEIAAKERRTHAASNGLGSIQIAPDLLQDLVPAAPSSIQIAPDLLTELVAAAPAASPPAPDEPGPAPAATSPAPAVTRPAPETRAGRAVSRPAAEPQPAPTTPAPVAARTTPVRTRKISSEFDALEKDFFAREADLYKQEKVEDFTDLDTPGKRR